MSVYTTAQVCLPYAGAIKFEETGSIAVISFGDNVEQRVCITFALGDPETHDAIKELRAHLDSVEKLLPVRADGAA